MVEHEAAPHVISSEHYTIHSKNLSPKKDKENVVQITRIDNGHVPQNAKFIDSCQQLFKYKFPRDYWERKPGCW
eukprot:6983094-Karenia_brevis.AAC.1